MTQSRHDYLIRRQRLLAETLAELDGCDRVYLDGYRAELEAVSRELELERFAEAIRRPSSRLATLRVIR